MYPLHDRWVSLLSFSVLSLTGGLIPIGHARVAAVRIPDVMCWCGLGPKIETLAKSPNTKVVVIGNSKNGLPLILGQ